MLDVKIPAPGTKARAQYDNRQLKQAARATEHFLYVIGTATGTAEGAVSIIRNGFWDTDQDGNPAPGMIAERVADANKRLQDLDKDVSDAKAKMDAALSVLSPEKHAEDDQNFYNLDLGIEAGMVVVDAMREWVLKETQKHRPN